LTSLNSGTIKTDGIDFGFDYNFPLSAVGLPGKLSFSDTATLTLSFLAADQSGSINDFLGKIQQTSSPFTSANPKLQNRLTTAWSNDSFSFAWSARYIGDVRRYTDPNAPAADCSVAGDCLPSIWYNDVVASYKYQRLTVIAGADNLFDKKPRLGRTRRRGQL
jgi:outer membrane receptor protein involved in Fe transport